MRDTAFDEYFRIVFPGKQNLEVLDDDDFFEKGSWVGPRSKYKEYIKVQLSAT